jgi:hypothetical protein
MFIENVLFYYFKKVGDRLFKSFFFFEYLILIFNAMGVFPNILFKEYLEKYFKF